MFCAQIKLYEGQLNVYPELRRNDVLFLQAGKGDNYRIIYCVRDEKWIQREFIIIVICTHFLK